METILVVDHSAKAREIAGVCLRDFGMSPLFAANGREALEVLARERPSAVLTGLKMPVMDGQELVERMREDYPSIPVVLLTAHGSERVAVDTLKAGALSFVPKKDLKTDLRHAMNVVLAAVEASRHRQQVKRLLDSVESRFVLGVEGDNGAALVSHFQSNLAQYGFCDETSLFQISLCLAEALNNALDHGSLELNSNLREQDLGAYEKVRNERMRQRPYCDRRVYVSERLTPKRVTYVIRDEGPGFDVGAIPDPTDPDNLLKVSGRGLMLISTFMDSVRFNESGNEITMSKRIKLAKRVD